jgi:hypothetical protein
MPRPICFMVTPFGKKPTGGGENTPAEVDFDALWNQALWPLLDGLGYAPVRADQDLGASIITEMIERLALSDLVLADLSLPNANVYYEVGVRHAAREKGCVLIAADWSKQPFDTSQMRQLRYPLPNGKQPDPAAIKHSLEKGIQTMRDSLTPCHALEGFPNLSVVRTTAFASFLRELSAFQSRVRRIYLEPAADERKKRVAETVAAAPVGAMSASMAQELVALIRDCGEGFLGVVAFIAQLPDALKAHPVIEEQRLLACAEAGDPLEAIAGLEELIHRRGGTPERLGLLGGRSGHPGSRASSTKPSTPTAAARCSISTRTTARRICRCFFTPEGASKMWLRPRVGRRRLVWRAPEAEAAALRTSGCCRRSLALHSMLRMPRWQSSSWWRSRAPTRRRSSPGS